MSKVQDLARKQPSEEVEIKNAMIQGRVTAKMKNRVRRILDERGLTWDDLVAAACEDIMTQTQKQKGDGR